MSYVKRDNSGKIIAFSLNQADGFQEQIDVRSEEFLDFLNTGVDRSDAAKLALNKTDADIARVTEDLINLLVDKQVLLFTELPLAVQDKLLEREKLRQTLQTIEPSIIDDAGSI